MIEVFGYLPFKKQLVSLANLYNHQRLKKIKTPENLIFFITNKCNARCKHCFYWKELNKKDSELTLSQIKKIVSSLKNRIETLSLTGGEPFLRKDIYEIIELFYKINHLKKVHITSNGSLPEDIFKICKKILENMKIELSVQISIDGDEDFHDKLRGVKIYKKAIESLKLLKTLSKNKNFILTTSTTLTKFNLRYLDFLSKEMKALGVEWGFALLRGPGYGIINLDKDFIMDYNPRDKSMNLPSIEDIEKINKKFSNKNDLRMILQRNLIKNSIMILKNQKPPLLCRAGIVDGVIYSNGDVSLCEITKPIGNLKDYDFNFYYLWNSEKAKIARKKIKYCSCIHPCHIINSMKYDYRFLLS